jgi:hypothetical protein
MKDVKAKDVNPGIDTSYFEQDTFAARRASQLGAGVAFNPESLITGKELADGFTYTNSRRKYASQEQYNAIIAGEIPASEVPTVAPRVRVIPAKPRTSTIRARLEYLRGDGYVSRAEARRVESFSKLAQPKGSE